MNTRIRWLLVLGSTAFASCTTIPQAPPADEALQVWRESQRRGVCVIHHVPLQKQTSEYYRPSPNPPAPPVNEDERSHQKLFTALIRLYPNQSSAAGTLVKPDHYPCSITVGVCPICERLRYAAEDRWAFQRYGYQKGCPLDP